MRTLSKLLAATAIAGAIGVTPAAAQMHRHGGFVHQPMRAGVMHGDWHGGSHWRGHDRDGRGGWSFGFYGYPYYTAYPYDAPYYYYDCGDPYSPYYDTDYCWD